MAEFERSFLTQPARLAAIALVQEAHQRGWKTIKIDDLVPLGHPLFDATRLFIWEEATRLGLTCNYTPTEKEQKQLTRRSSLKPSNDSQTPT